MKIGARVWKTALAVTVAIALSRVLGLDHPVFAGIAAIICMQPTIAGSLRKGTERMQATIIGAIFSLLALIAIETFPVLLLVRPAVVGFTVLVVMVVTIRLGWLDSLVLAAATVVVIMILPPDENIYLYAGSRTLVTFVGIIVATFMNAVFITPRYSEPLWLSMEKLVISTHQVYLQAVEAFCYRKMDLAREAAKALEDSESLFLSVSTPMQWIEEEEKLRERLRGSPRMEVERLSRAVELMASIRASTATILSITTETFAKSPEYTDAPAPIYDTLCELAQVSFALFEHVEARLSAEKGKPLGECKQWTEQLHSRFIESIREGRGDVFPLVEVSVVGFEVRRVTEALSELDEALSQISRS